MSDLFTATAQRNITYLWLLGIFMIIGAQGLGYLKNVPNDVYTLTAMILMFWFQRTRTQEKPDPTTTTVKTETTTLPSTPTGEP